MSRAARADGQPAPLAARRPQLRVLLRGPAALGQDRGRVRARRAVAGRRHHGEALRRQRRRVRASQHQLGDRRPHAARAHAGAVRARGARGRRAGDHDRVQPAQRAALLGAPPADHRDPARRVGLRGLRAHRLAERGLHRSVRRPRASTSRCPGRAQFYGKLLGDAVRRGRRARVPSSTSTSPTCSQVFDRVGALDDDPDVGEHVDRPARTPRAGARSRGRGDGAADATYGTVLPFDRPTCARWRCSARTRSARR